MWALAVSIVAQSIAAPNLEPSLAESTLVAQTSTSALAAADLPWRGDVDPTTSIPPQVVTPPAPDADEDWANLDFRVSLGAEWDTNSTRAVSTDVQVLPGASSLGAPAADALTRLVTSLDSSFLLTPGHQLELGYVLGAKRFFRRTTEDLLVHDLSASTGHYLTDWLSANSWGTLRASRLRRGERDYTLATAGAAFNVHPSEMFTFGANGSFSVFEFDAEERLSFASPSIGASLTFRPWEKVSLEARFDQRWRRYNGNALNPAVGRQNNIEYVTISYCDQIDDPIVPPDCTPVLRRDRESVISVRLAYRGRVVLAGEYQGRIQRSTSELESIDRHRGSISATFPLFLELTGNVAAALQLNNGVSVTDTKFLAEDDENQNSVQVQISRMITDALSAEVRYALFANQFTTADVSFLRQTFYLGVTYRIRPEVP